MGLLFSDTMSIDRIVENIARGWDDVSAWVYPMDLVRDAYDYEPAGRSDDRDA